jgi:uncharacterized protein DUF5916/cellulose/xylan binding protein with CBM9 domain
MGRQRHTLFALLLHSVVTATATPARAQANSSPVAPSSLPESRAVRASGRIHLDGKLDEPAWAEAPVTDIFTQVDPLEGQPASQKTEVRVVYDDDALYVGARLHDTGRITARLGRRDMPLGDSDWFGVMIDSYHDHRTAFGFDVNPAGVRRDEVKTIDQDDNSWDPVWEVATSRDSVGWTAEYRIPFSQLRFGSAETQVWGILFERVIGRNHEYAVSTFVPKKERGGVPRYGHLSGLHNVQAGKRLEFLPYTVSRAEYIDRGLNPYKTGSEYSATAGLDLVMRASSNLTVNATINPDFGQVEVDPAVVNLGVYETFFQEKRPFFVEGSEIFAFGAEGTSGGQLFYSRRIGREPSLAPPTPEADVPDATTILGAAKLSGKAAGWSLGVLEAVTDKETARFRTSDAADREMIVEPLSNYFVGRARREMHDGRTFVGGIVSAVNRRLDTDVLSSTLRQSAYAGGVDFRHEIGDRTWVVQGDAEGSRIAGTPSAMVIVQEQPNHYLQRPDADHLGVDSSATSLTGYSVNASLAKQQGEHWRGSVAGALTSPRYEVNDMGFSYRTDRQDAELDVRYVENRPGQVWRRWETGAAMRSEHNYAFDPILTIGTLSVEAQTVGYWTVFANAQRFFTAYDDRLTRGGPMALRPAQNTANLMMESDTRKPITMGLGLGVMRGDYDQWNWSASVEVGVKGSSRWNLTLAPLVTRQRVAAQYVATVDDPSYAPTFGHRYVFAPLDQTEVGLETRFNLTFTPRLTLETYVQPLISSADYGPTKQLVAPKTFDFVPYTGSTPDLDFNLRSLRGNAVLRWEWRQGSTLYVAWQQQRADMAPYGDFALGRDRRALFRARPDDIFVVKINYWLNP